MLKNALFFVKSWKNRRSVGGSAPKPHWPPAAGGSVPRPQVVTLTQLTCYFRLLLRFLGIVKITTYYLILERRLGPLSQACPPPPLAQTSSYAIGYSVARELFLDRESKTRNAKLMGSVSNLDRVFIRSSPDLDRFFVPEISVL